MLSGFAVRGGYSSMGVVGGSDGLSSMRGFATGFGLKAYNMGLDYSVTPFGELGSVQRLSLGMRF